MKSELKEDEISIKDEDGKEYLMKILFSYDNEERGKKYVFIYDESDPDEIYVFEYKDDGELLEVSDEEYEEAQEVLEAYDEDPKIKDAKEGN
jgi:uncharacterized protein YrzB (UPF0473 family)